MSKNSCIVVDLFFKLLILDWYQFFKQFLSLGLFEHATSPLCHIYHGNNSWTVFWIFLISCILAIFSIRRATFTLFIRRIILEWCLRFSIFLVFGSFSKFNDSIYYIFLAVYSGPIILFVEQQKQLPLSLSALMDCSTPSQIQARGMVRLHHPKPLWGVEWVHFEGEVG